MKRDLKWRLLHAFHNMVAHPLLPLAELLKDVGLEELAGPAFRLHDATNPQDDQRNQQTYRDAETKAKTKKDYGAN